VNDINATQKTREQLRALSEHLCERRDAILQGWRTSTENSPELTIASSLTNVQFNDHIPGVLEAFAHKLRAWPDEQSAQAQLEEKEQVTGHGLQRWQQGYQLRELTREWGHLQMCLMEELEEYAIAHPDLEPPVMMTARRALAHLCWDGISDSTTQYWRLHQAEAAGHVRDLQQALTTLNELDRARAEAWREAAHDLRGSLSVVKGATSMLDRKDMPEPVRDEFFDILQIGVSSLHDMLNDLMSLARLEAGQELRNVAPFDAAAFLIDFCTTSMPIAEERGLYLKMEGPESLPVEGDRPKIQRIVQNLLLNALKYTQRGGVTVIWGLREDPDARSWMFCIQDTGPGLDSGPGAPLARQLYEATQSSHEVDDLHGKDAPETPVANAPTVPAQSETLPANQIPGEGVGLSIVKRLCELLDASLELETSPGEGSTFRVIMPCRYDKG
jgi:signal transduction histidine kinase